MSHPICGRLPGRTASKAVSLQFPPAAGHNRYDVRFPRYGVRAYLTDYYFNRLLRIGIPEMKGLEKTSPFPGKKYEK